MTIYYVKLAWRSVRATPRLSALTILTFAVGIATTVLALTLMHALSANPLPGKSHTLLRVEPPTPVSGKLPGVVQIQDALEMHRRWPRSVVLAGDGSVRVKAPNNRKVRATIRFTTRSFFTVFDAPMLEGSPWSNQDDDDGSPLVVIGRSLAQDLFGTEHAVGRVLDIAGATYRVVGILNDWRPAPRFYDLQRGAYKQSDQIYAPLRSVAHVDNEAFVGFVCPPSGDGIDLAAAFPAGLMTSRCLWTTLWAEVPTPEDHRRASQVFTDYWRSKYADSPGKPVELLDLAGVLERADVVPGSVRIYTVMALAFLFLCIANASGILLAKFLRRGSEIGIRRALGASRRAILLQFLVEALLMGLCGGLLGLLLTSAGLYGVNRMPLAFSGVAQVDGWTVLLTFVAVTVSGVAAGLVPASVASRAPPFLQMKGQ